MFRTVGADEIAEMEAYYAIAPWSQERQDYRFAMLAQMMAAFGGQKSGTIKDYLICPVTERKQQSLESIRAAARGLAAWFSGNRSKS